MGFSSFEVPRHVALFDAHATSNAVPPCLALLGQGYARAPRICNSLERSSTVSIIRRLISLFGETLPMYSVLCLPPAY